MSDQDNPNLGKPEEARSPLASARPGLYGAQSIYGHGEPEDFGEVLQTQAEDRNDGFVTLLVRNGNCRVMVLRWMPEAGLQAATLIGRVFENMGPENRARNMIDMTDPAWRARTMANEPTDPAEAFELMQQEQKAKQERRLKRALENQAASSADPAPARAAPTAAALGPSAPAEPTARQELGELASMGLRLVRRVLPRALRR